MMKIRLLGKNSTLYGVAEEHSLTKKFIDRIKWGVDDLFTNVEIETSSRCNRVCVYCPNSFNHRGTFFMRESLFFRIIDQLKELGFSGIIRPHFYNEPLLDKRLPALLKYTRNSLKHATIHLYTNGDFLTDELFSELISAGVNKFIVTSHDGTIRDGMKTLLSTPMGKQYIYHQFITKKTRLLNRGGTVKVNNQIILKTCDIPTTNITINYKGQVVLCCNDALSQNVMGDLNTETILDIWRNPKFRQIRKETMVGDYKLDICKKCTYNKA